MFTNRSDAGRKLADLIALHSNQRDVIVVGIPRGGVVVANEIARKHSLLLEVILVKKLAHPMNDEVAIGAVSMESTYIENNNAFEEHWLREEINRKRRRIKEMMKLFDVEPIPNVYQKDVILVDDGVATGSTLIHAIDLLKKRSPRSIAVAVPVCPSEMAVIIEAKVDAFYCLEQPRILQAIGEFYESFIQVEDEEVKWMLDQNKKARIYRA